MEECRKPNPSSETANPSRLVHTYRGMHGANLNVLGRCQATPTKSFTTQRYPTPSTRRHYLTVDNERGATLASRPDSRQKQAPSILPTCKLFVLISGECFVPSIPRSKGHSVIVGQLKCDVLVRLILFVALKLSKLMQRPWCCASSRS